MTAGPDGADSLVCNGVIVRGGGVRSSVLSPEVLVESGSRGGAGGAAAQVPRCGCRAVVRDAILDKNVVVAEGATIGVDRNRGPRLRRLGRPHHRRSQGSVVKP